MVDTLLILMSYNQKTILARTKSKHIFTILHFEVGSYKLHVKKYLTLYNGTTSAFCDSFLRHQGIEFRSSSRTSYTGLGTRLIVKNK